VAIESRHPKFDRTSYVIKKQFEGNDPVEILEDGQPYWVNLPGACNYFSFGYLQASAILTCMPDLKQFYDAEGRYPSDGCHVEMQEQRLIRPNIKQHLVLCKLATN
jgi:hypothetical protein